MKINEVFDKPYQYSWDEQGGTDGEWSASADLADGSHLMINFAPLYLDGSSYEINFMRGDMSSFNANGAGDEVRVFGTVVSAVKEWFKWQTSNRDKNNPLREIHFHAAKNETVTRGRTALYSRFAKKFAAGTNMSLSTVDNAKETTFILKRFKKKKVQEVNVDNLDGRGATPNNMNVNYLGMKVEMRPTTFIKLAAPLGRDQAKQEMIDYVSGGGAIGAPFLIIKYNEGQVPEVVGHEGRNRMLAVYASEGDVPVETHLFFRGDVNRARHLTPEIIAQLKSGMEQEVTGQSVKGPLWEDGKIVKGVNTTADVKPGETRRQAAKFGNKVDKNGRPPLLNRKAKENTSPHVLSNLGLTEDIQSTAYGYKIMNYNPDTDEVISGADSRVTKGLKLTKGMTMKMPGKGIFMSNNREYVETYYGGHNDNEVLIKFKFDPSTITSGNMTDRESEFTVPRATVVGFKTINNLDEDVKAVTAVGVDAYASETDTMITLDHVKARERGYGAGTKYMQALTKYADSVGKPIALTPSNSLGGSVPRLKKFYKRFGFVDNKGRNKDYETRETMIRYPNTMNEAIRTIKRGKDDKFNIDTTRYQVSGEPIAKMDGFTIYYEAELRGDRGIIIAKGDKVAGLIILSYTSNIEQKVLGVGTSVVGNEFQGKGVVYKAYVALIKAGYSLISDDAQTKGGQIIWKKLAKTPGVFVYGISDVKTDATYTQIDPEDMSGDIFAVYRDDQEDRDEIEEQLGKIAIEIQELKYHIEDMETDIEQGHEHPDIDEYRGHLKSMGYEAKALSDELHALKKDDRQSRYARLMATADTKQTTNEEIKKPHPDDTLGVKRADMPQVHRDHYPELFAYLESHGATMTKGNVPATSLRATQSEFSDEGVEKMIAKGGVTSDSKDKKPLIVSSDNFIIDGHHRWLAAYNQEETVPIIRFSVPVRQLLQLVRDFKHTTYKDIYNENLSITGTQRSKQDRKKKLQPGTEAWFKHWFSRPRLTRKDVNAIKEEVATHVKERRDEKETGHRRFD